MTDDQTTDTATEDTSTDEVEETPEDTSTDEPQTFDRTYVEELREQAAGYRVKAKRADVLAGRLVTAYAAATGKLADPTDLPVTDELLDDDGLPDAKKIEQAIADLIVRKPHLAARRVAGDVGQGARPTEDTFSLQSLLRAGAG